MMNAKEAMNKVNAYIEETATAIIADAGYQTRWLDNGALRISWED